MKSVTDALRNKAMDAIYSHARSTVAADGTEDDTAVEVMARAIYEAHHNTFGFTWPEIASGNRGKEYRAQARAALTALRGRGE